MKNDYFAIKIAVFDFENYLVIKHNKFITRLCQLYYRTINSWCKYRFGPFMFYLLLVYHQSLKFQIWLDTSNNVFTLNIKFEIWKDIKISHCTNTSVDELVFNSFLHVSILMGINQNRWLYKNINWKTNSCFTYIHDVYERNSL